MSDNLANRMEDAIEQNTDSLTENVSKLEVISSDRLLIADADQESDDNLSQDGSKVEEVVSNNSLAASTSSSSVGAASLESSSVEDGKKTKAKKSQKPFLVRRSGKVKDLSAPKKPLSGFMIWSSEVRESVRKELGGSASVPDVGRELGKRWREIDAESKRKYALLADKDKERYKAEMEAYTPSYHFLEAKKANEKKMKVDRNALKKASNAPKKPLTAFFIYVNENRALVAASEGMSDKRAVLKELGSRWGKLTNEEKEKYEEKAAIDKERYSREMASYVPTPEFLELKEQMEQRKKEKKDPKQKLANSAQDPRVVGQRPGPAGTVSNNNNRSSFYSDPRNLKPIHYFGQDVMPEVKMQLGGLSPELMAKEVERRWNLLGPKAREHYFAKAHASRQ